MKATNCTRLTIKKVPIKYRQKVEDEIKVYTYEAWGLRGWLNGQRIRKQFEAAFSRLGERSLSEAIEWFLANYRAPHKEMPLGSPEVEGTAAALFLAERAKHVRPFVLSDYKCTMKDFCAAFPTRKVHEIPTEDVQLFLDKRNVGKKRFNNMRGEICTFFGYCMTAPRNGSARIQRRRSPRSRSCAACEVASAE